MNWNVINTIQFSIILDFPLRKRVATWYIKHPILYINQVYYSIYLILSMSGIVLLMSNCIVSIQRKHNRKVQMFNNTKRNTKVNSKYIFSVNVARRICPCYVLVRQHHLTLNGSTILSKSYKNYKTILVLLAFGYLTIMHFKKIATS